MPLIRQNFSIAAGDDTQLPLDIGPDVGSSLVGANLTFRVYEQDAGVRVGLPIITKDLGSGLTVADPTYQMVLVAFVPADTLTLAPKNYIHEATVYQSGRRTTVSEGVMTVNRSSNPTVGP